MKSAITLRRPEATDGLALNRLVAACSPLDPNSVYCNLLHTSHFAATGVAAELDGELVGFISGYRIPEAPSTLFIWQVAVGEKARGQGLARRMLDFIVDSDGCEGVDHMQTTITDSNRASWALFESFARGRSAQVESAVWLEKERHFGGLHDAEVLVTIGPFERKRSES